MDKGFHDEIKLHNKIYAIKTNSFEEIKEWLYGEIKKQENQKIGKSKECTT